MVHSKIRLTLILFSILIVSFFIQQNTVYGLFKVETNFRLGLLQSHAVGFKNIFNDVTFLALELTQGNYLNVTTFFILSDSQGEFIFTSNINGTIKIYTNMTSVRYKINEYSWIRIENEGQFNFLNGNKIYIRFGIPDVLINAYFGLVGIVLFCISPIIAYKLSDDAQDKIKFMFILIPLLVISIGFSLSFIYSGF